VKRISISLMVLGLGILGAIAIASAGTSTITTACKSLGGTTHDCLWGQEVRPGTEIHAKLAPGTKALLSASSENEGWLGACNESEITATLYGSPTHKDIVGPVSISFAACETERHMETLETEGHVISWLAGSDNGEFSMPYNRIKDHPEYVLGVRNCEYELPPGKLVGGSMEASGPKILYSSTIFGGEEVRAKKTGGESGCPAVAYFKATYNITSPAPLYIENT